MSCPALQNAPRARYNHLCTQQTGISYDHHVRVHARLHERGTRATVVAGHTQLERKLQPDALRRCLLRLAHDAHRFLHMRAALLRSLAAQLVAGYISGIGDRHLGNVLLDTVHGTLIPIDFGYVNATAACVVQCAFYLITPILPLLYTVCTYTNIGMHSTRLCKC